MVDSFWLGTTDAGRVAGVRPRALAVGAKPLDPPGVVDAMGLRSLAHTSRLCLSCAAQTMTTPSIHPPVFRAAVMVALCTLTGSCSAAYPRYTTALHEAPPGLTASGSLTPPPDHIHRISAIRADVPQQTRDGRPWDRDPGPDAYVTVFRNGTEVFKSSVAANSFRPTWDPNREHADLRIRDSDQLRVELRDDDGISSELIGTYELRGVPTDARNGGIWLIRLEGGAMVQLQSNPPPAHLGMGLTYEFRTDVLVVNSVEETGSASFAGLRPGDRITAINGRSIRSLGDVESRQLLDRGAMTDVTLTVVHGQAAPTEVVVRRDALYLSR